MLVLYCTFNLSAQISLSFPHLILPHRICDNVECKWLAAYIRFQGCCFVCHVFRGMQMVAYLVPTGLT